MGLKERRVAKEFQENRYESLKNQINKAAKFDVEIEVNRDTLSIDNYSHFYDDTWPKIYFQPLEKALKEMCSDDFTQEAIQEGVKKVIIQNYSANHVASRFAEFKKGVLTLNHCPITNAHHIQERAENIQYVVEKEL